MLVACLILAVSIVLLVVLPPEIDDVLVEEDVPSGT